MTYERLDGLIIAAATSVGGGIMWLMRKVLTNEKQIALLTAEIANRDKLRQEDREAVAEVREDVKGLRKDFSAFMRREK